MRINPALSYPNFINNHNNLSIKSSQEVKAVGSEVSNVEEPKSKGTEKIQIAGVSPYQNTAVEDIDIDLSQKFDPKTSESNGFASKDIQKAISSMEKDSLLHEYQYFVGNDRRDTLVFDDDGIVTRVK